MKRYFLISYRQPQYGQDNHNFMGAMDKTPVEFILWSADYAEKYPEQQYGEVVILFAMEITEDEYNKLNAI